MKFIIICTFSFLTCSLFAINMEDFKEECIVFEPISFEYIKTYSNKDGNSLSFFEDIADKMLVKNKAFLTYVENLKKENELFAMAPPKVFKTKKQWKLFQKQSANCNIFFYMKERKEEKKEETERWIINRTITAQIIGIVIINTQLIVTHNNIIQNISTEVEEQIQKTNQPEQLILN